MSVIHPRICPIMSRSIHIPDSAGPDIDDHGAEDNDYLIEIECKGKDCMWYISNEDECSVKWQALMVMAMFERQEEE